jgi:hypothetical protein
LEGLSVGVFVLLGYVRLEIAHRIVLAVFPNSRRAVMDRIEDGISSRFPGKVKKVRPALENRDSPENWPSEKVATRSASPGFFSSKWSRESRKVGGFRNRAATEWLMIKKGT